jgi:predicted DNA-binding transcriptional regulator AlpA
VTPKPRQLNEEFIDRYQAAELLALSAPESLYRYRARHADTFPPPVRRVANTDIWRASPLLAWHLRLRGERVPTELSRAANLPLAWPAWAVDRDEAAAFLGITPGTVSRYGSEKRVTPDFPEPIKCFAGHPIWDSRTLAAWSKARPGLRGGPPGERVKALCSGCEERRVLRVDGNIVVHTWNREGRLEQCPGSGVPPASLPEFSDVA